MFYTYRKVLVIASVVFCLFSIVSAYSGGSGTAENPYQISDTNDLLALAGTPTDYNKCFILTANIDMEGQVFTMAIIAADTSPNSGFQGAAFTGTFDGNGHIIHNAKINRPNGYYIGLFGYVGSAGRVCNLSVEDVNIIGGSYVGGLAGMNDGNIVDCCATGAITGEGGEQSSVGGLVGYNSSATINGPSGTITDCYVTGSVNGAYRVGGLVGSNYGSISDCYATSSVVGSRYSVGGLVGGNLGSISDCHTAGTVDGNTSNVGGLVGWNKGGSVSNCYTISVTGTIYINNQRVGGLIGWNEGGTITDCYAIGTVTGNKYVGGLVGGNEYEGIVTNCYATGTVIGNFAVGGLAGCNDERDTVGWGVITACYAVGAVTGGSYVGGLVGYNYGYLGNTTASFWDVNTSGQATSAGGEGKTTEEMQTLSTFTSAGWDFSYTDGNSADWFIQIDEYPILTWQISPADIYTDGRNNFRDFAVFAQYWMREDCAIYNYYCDLADLNFDGSVDVDDLIILMSYWLESGIYE